MTNLGNRNYYAGCPNKSHYASGPPVSLISAYKLNSKTIRLRKTKTATNVLLVRSNRCANFQLKRSNFKVIRGQKPKNDIVYLLLVDRMLGGQPAGAPATSPTAHYCNAVCIKIKVRLYYSAL